MQTNQVKIGGAKKIDLRGDTITDEDYTSQSYRFLGKQLNTDPHGIQDVQVGIQFIRLMLGNLTSDSVVSKVSGVDGSLTKDQLLELHTKIVDRMSDISVRKTLGKLGVTIVGDKVTYDQEKMSKFLREEAENGALDRKVVEALNIGRDGNLVNDLSAIPESKSLQNKLKSAIVKAAAETTLQHFREVS